MLVADAAYGVPLPKNFNELGGISMQYRNFGKLGYEVSALGMGCMRLPRIYDGSAKAQVDVEKSVELIRYAAEHGVNYFDTALGYHNGDSESVLGEALVGYREKVKIVTKQPVRAMTTQADIRRNLENTLQKLRTDYLDVYLVHFISALSWDEIKARQIFAEYEKFKAEGLIRAIGFSYHGELPLFREVLAEYPWEMCLVQQNLIDVDKLATAEAIRLAGQKGVALAIMEPLRGGGLAAAPPPVAALYEQTVPGRRPVEWAFRHVLNYPEVSTVLSGMTTLAQLQENIAIFSQPDALPNCLSAEEKKTLSAAKTAYENLVAVPCTGCEYCLPCPEGVNIPTILDILNEVKMFGDLAQPKRRYMFEVMGKRDASLCSGCAACEMKCPQNIEIIDTLEIAHETVSGWVE
jgi:predicted aldo/keto reductase-like oxidoreductase